MAKASDNVFPKLIESMQTTNPAAPADSSWKIFAKADGIYARSSNTVTGPFGSAGAATVTHTYIGYNTIGGSSAAAVANKIYMKKVTLAAAATVTDIGIYLKQNAGGATITLAAGIWTDNSGTPQYVIAGASTIIFAQVTSGTPGDARWFSVAMGTYLTAGDYWIGVQTSNANYDVYNDGSGSDKTNLPNSTPQLADFGGNIYTNATTTNKYSIRASTLA